MTQNEIEDKFSDLETEIHAAKDDASSAKARVVILQGIVEALAKDTALSEKTRATLEGVLAELS